MFFSVVHLQLKVFCLRFGSGFWVVTAVGWNRVKPWVHFVSTVGVFLRIDVFSRLDSCSNSWQQTPAGFHIVGEGMQARAEITDFWAMVFNPSSVDRLTHV